MPKAVARFAQPTWYKRLGLAGVVVAAVFVVKAVVGDIPGQCGPVSSSISSIVRAGRSPKLFAKLRSMESSGPDAQRIAARTARIQCGMVGSQDEVVESVALQLVATGLRFDGTNSSWLFAAATAARERGGFGADGKVDALEVLRWALSQPQGSMPNEFERDRASVPEVIRFAERIRSSWR
jgi:hypothetical protein